MENGDYIKREDAIEVLAEHLKWEDDEEGFGTLDLDGCRYIAKNQLESVPSVDVVEVKGKTMSDYITKDEVLTLLNPNDTRISEPYIALVREEIKLRPSADVVEVVRCKDCIHYDERNRWQCDRFGQSVNADDYCSYGERGDDE